MASSAEVHATPGDQAMGLELQAIELQDELEWAESQRRTEDVAELRARLFEVLDELGRVADRIPGGLAA
ncbi:MAG TPA: hypothetical protein VGJ03_14985 [Acidimicrobiales bacterium]|jgi:hypothetical protein